MSTLVVKNLPDELHEKLRDRAKRHHRSVNKETVAMLEETLNAASHPGELPPPIRLKSGHMLSIEEIEDAIAEGRE